MQPCIQNPRLRRQIFLARFHVDPADPRMLRHLHNLLDGERIQFLPAKSGQALPQELKSSLPTIKQLEAELKTIQPEP